MKRTPSAIICGFSGLCTAALGAESRGDENGSSADLSVATSGLIERGQDETLTESRGEQQHVDSSPTPITSGATVLGRFRNRQWTSDP